jgi:amicyanin
MLMTLIAAASVASLSTPAPAAVTIGNFAFAPKVLTVVSGATVTWTNQDDTPHNVVAVKKTFRSATLDTDERFSMTFTRPGTYDYFCALHPHMTGRIVVKAR